MQVGERYRDKDLREDGKRIVEVIEIDSESTDPGYKRVRIKTIASTYGNTGRTSWVKAERFVKRFEHVPTKQYEEK